MARRTGPRPEQTVVAAGPAAAAPPKGIATEAFAKVEIRSAAELWDWLAANHNLDVSVWLVTHKKHTGDTYVSVGEVLDTLIAYGWIDGIRRKLDADRTMQLIAPRKTEAWAATYKTRAARLTAEGRMTAAGLAAIDRAKRADLWNAMSAVDALMVPDDLLAALRARPPAEANFRAAAPSYRRNVLRLIHKAKRPETRRKRIDQAVAFAFAGERMPQM